MNLTVREKLKILLGRKNLTIKDLADKLGTSRQNLSNKFSRDNFSEKDIKQIAEALNCDCEIKFKMKDTGEEI